MNCLNSMQNNIISTSSKEFSVTFDTQPADGTQFFKQTTTDELYDVYTIVGQTATDGTPYATWADKTVVATFKAKNTTKTIYYVCVGGGGYTYYTTTVAGGGGGAGGQRNDTFYRYGRPGAIIIAIPKT